LLQLEGAAVNVAISGEQALALCRDVAFDVIVSDLAMPGMDGIALLPHIHAIPDNARAGAILYTGFNQPQDVRRATAAGFSGCLGKPVAIDETVALILRVATETAGRA
jgi:two-component system CheB/CheR fusion protein